MDPGKRLDAGSLVVMAVTLLLFVAAVFVKGMTHELLLEAGVFLVSVKLIIMAYKNSVSAEMNREELREIKAILRQPRHDSVEAGERPVPPRE
jgi:hypothetical protein